MLRRLLTRLRHLLGASRFRRDLETEMTFHIERLTEDLIREGLDPEEARRAARIRFGSTERVQARVREERGLALFDETARNLRLALRGTARSPLFTMSFVGTLGLCIGLGTAAFSVADAALWRPLPYPDPDRLAHATLHDPTYGEGPRYTAVDGRTWERLRDEAVPFPRAVYSDAVRGVNLGTREAAAFVRQQRVGAGYFGVLGVTPVLGREFQVAEDVQGGPPLAVLSHGLWTRTFGGDPATLGRTIRLKGEEHTVVGILPADFRPAGPEADVWTPLRASRAGEGGGNNFEVLIRIPRGMSFAEADARLASIEPPPSSEDDAAERRFFLVPLADFHAAGARLSTFMLLGAVGLMLVVGCANLAGLQIARSLARRPEMATRQALGSGGATLVRQTVVENVLLGMIGGLVGLAVAYVAVAGLEGVVQSRFGIWQEVRLDGRSVAAAAGLTALATFLFGLVPVVQVGKPGTYRLLVAGSRVVGRGGHRLRKTLFVGQVAVVTALLFAAGLLVRSSAHLEGLDPGFRSEGVLTVQFSLDDARYAEADRVRRLFRESLREIGRVPGVRSAAVSLTLPYERALNTPFDLRGEETFRLTNVVYVTPGFFRTLLIPLLQGRRLEDGDREGAPRVAVANQAWVEANVADRPPLGTLLDIRFGGGDDVSIVGVVGNVQQSAGFGTNSRPVWETPTLYLPSAQVSPGFFRMVHVSFTPSWIVRGEGPRADLAAGVTRVFRQVDPELPVARVATLDEVMDRAFAQQRFEAAFLIAVAAFALLLAAVGLYGIVAHEVLERRTEMGLRMALGATPGRAVWTAGAGGLRLTALGLVLGGVATLGVSRVMATLVWGVAPYDPAILATLVGVLALLAAVASFLPAARIGRMDPSRILREG